MITSEDNIIEERQTGESFYIEIPCELSDDGTLTIPAIDLSLHR
jgi:hypothetical protein